MILGITREGDKDHLKLVGVEYTKLSAPSQNSVAKYQLTADETVVIESMEYDTKWYDPYRGVLFMNVRPAVKSDFFESASLDLPLIHRSEGNHSLDFYGCCRELPRQYKEIWDTTMAGTTNTLELIANLWLYTQLEPADVVKAVKKPIYIRRSHGLPKSGERLYGNWTTELRNGVWIACYSGKDSRLRTGNMPEPSKYTQETINRYNIWQRRENPYLTNQKELMEKHPLWTLWQDLSESTRAQVVEGMKRTNFADSDKLLSNNPIEFFGALAEITHNEPDDEPRIGSLLSLEYKTASEYRSSCRQSKLTA